jgi:hypothetical protein
MTNTYASTEIAQAGDPTMIAPVNQTPNLSNNLYSDSYPSAPGRLADANSPTNSGSDLASRGLSMISQGDQYDGIMALLDAERQSPQSVQGPQFLQQLQIVENQPTSAGTTDGTTDANAIASQALSAAQSDPVSGILGLMKAATLNPNLDQDQNFLTTMQEVLPSGQGTAQQPTDGQQAVQAQTADDSQPQVQTQPSDASQQDAQPQTAPSIGIQAGQQLTDTTNNPASADPQIQNAISQAFQMLQSGDQYDAARLLMMIAKADPQILQDQVFIKNLQTAEQAAQASQSPTNTQSQPALSMNPSSVGPAAV